ncbi:MAG: hypothetical protein ABJD97_04015 [Betaproteobacteria bacterium]
MGTDSPLLTDPRDEPTAEILARAERWARSGRIEDALAACAALLPRFAGRPDAVAQGTCEHVMALSHLYAGRVKEAVLGGYRAIALLEGVDAVPRQLQVVAMQAGGLARLALRRRRWSCWTAPSACCRRWRIARAIAACSGPTPPSCTTP